MISLFKGQSLFEVLFATALAALIVTGVASLAITSVRNADFSRTQSEARQVAQNMLEQARIARDSNPAMFFSGTNPPFICPAQFAPNCNYTITRYASCGTCPVDTAEVVAEVSWTDATGTHTVEAETVLTDWEI